jgi:hypothetical protein
MVGPTIWVPYPRRVFVFAAIEVPGECTLLVGVI